MKAIQSTGSTEIYGVQCSQSGSSCKLTWKAASGGVIICFSQGFLPWPDIKEIAERLTDAQIQNLVEVGELSVAVEENNKRQNVLLEYMSASKIQARSASFDFNAKGKFALPLKVQLFSVSSDGTSVYIPSGTENTRIIAAEVRVHMEPAPLFKKGKKLSATGAGFNTFADGFLCYTVPGAPNDSNGFPMEYPIPNNTLTSGNLLPLDGDFKVAVARKWSDLVNLTISGDKK